MIQNQDQLYGGKVALLMVSPGMRPWTASKTIHSGTVKMAESKSSANLKKLGKHSPTCVLWHTNSSGFSLVLGIEGFIDLRNSRKAKFKRTLCWTSPSC